MTKKLVGLMLIVAMAGCATSSGIPRVEATKVAAVVSAAMGQSRAQVETTMGQRSDLFTLGLRPNERVQAWRYEERGEQYCLFVTYDLSDRVIEIAPVLKDRGRNPMPLPAGC